MSLLVQSDSVQMLSVCQLKLKSECVAFKCQLLPARLWGLSVKFDFLKQEVVHGSQTDGSERKI